MSDGKTTPVIISGTDNLLLRIVDKLEKQRLDLQKQLRIIQVQLDAIQKEVCLSEEETDSENEMETEKKDCLEPEKKLQKVSEIQKRK